ncbi:hypothetical protein BDN67DRAFT_552156 [Paxillus ammoniavirescens]|nr:hypothetical protein BDN67DRAFT_552156 [Paxillus ammoniavirescens]
MTPGQEYYPGFFDPEDNAQFVQTNTGYYTFNQDQGNSMPAFVFPPMDIPIPPDHSFTSIPHPQGGPYLNNPMQALSYSSVRQHNQPHQRLRVNTELTPRLLYDTATSSSTPYSNLPPATPSWQHYISMPFVQPSSPASASADLQKGILSLGLDAPPFPVSPFGPPSPDLDGGTFGDPTSHPLTDDVRSFRSNVSSGWC